MMASSKSICFDLVGLADIDIDMEVKSEHDSEEENYYDHNNCNSSDEFDVEFIIPEQRKPEETEIHTACIDSPQLLQTEIQDDSDEEVEDEPEVEIDEVTVQQELVEVELDPSLLLYVKRDKKPSDQLQQKQQLQTDLHLNQQKQIAEQEKTEDSHRLSISSLFPDQEDIFPALPNPNTRCKGSAVTAALRKVKRKPHREPLEPLKEIECSANNINNSRNIDSNKLRIDKQNIVDSADNANEDDDNDNCQETFCDPASPGYSDSEAKEQKQSMRASSMIIKRKRGRPRLKPLDFLEKMPAKRKIKNRKLRKKIKTKIKCHEVNKSDHLEQNELVEENNQPEKVLCVKQSEEINCNQEKKLENINSQKSDSDKKNVKKEKKMKKEKKKPSIFDEVKMDYTVLNNNEPKEKPKRIRKRDKKSREIATLSKPESFDCIECGRKFKEKSHLATHARAHIDIRNFKCNKCGSLFKTKTNLFFHMKTHSDAPFTCEKCNKTYRERRILMRHIRVVHSSQNMYSCDQCGREFKSMRNLSLHYTLHTGVKPFTCDHCSKSFVYKSTYIVHMKGHDADNSFNCELCPNTFNNKAEFRRLCNHHSEARPWLCTVCGKGYPLKGTLKNHMKTHEPEKPFKCTECPKSFMKKQSFECHLKIHAGESPQFMCDQCSQSYFNVFALKRHYLKHTSERKFVCEVCHKAFWMKDALKVHMRTHSNIKLFPCLQCPKAFAHKHSLDAHLRTHLDVQPYSCNVCQKTFIHKYNLARHERQHLLVSTMPVMPPSVISPQPQVMPISVMMLPPMPSSPGTTTLHIL
ncbi:uncharacterized protein LOC142326139 isoform X2 [Lycorma delicatula]